MTPESISKKNAFRFILLLGAVSLFADITYEGGRSIFGPYLAGLGASGAVVGTVAGFGELVGYALRLVTGYISDKTKRYWFFTILGYAVNLLAVPMLALVGRWELAVILMVTERIGKAIRTPSRDCLLSQATQEVGQGWGFGLHEAMDQIGAMLGPLLVALVLSVKGSYRAGFAVLFIPAFLALVILLVAKYFYPKLRNSEPVVVALETKGFSRVFWIYLLAVAFLAAGYADFPLMAYHFKKASFVSDNWIPIFYAIAMGVDALAALLFGRLFDRKGISILIFGAVISLFFSPLVFGKSFYLALFGIMLWGIGLGAQESIMRAAVAKMVSMDKRGSAYGIFNAGFGLFWFLGSAIMGIFYDISIPFVVAFSVLAQLISISFFILTKKRLEKYGQS